MLILRLPISSLSLRYRPRPDTLAQGISSGSIEKAPGFSARLFYFTVGLQAIYWVMFFVLVGSVVGVFMESKKSDKGGKGKKGNVRSVVEVKHKEGSEEVSHASHTPGPKLRGTHTHV